MSSSAKPPPVAPSVSMPCLSFKASIACTTVGTISEFLAQQTGLSHRAVKDAMAKGAVWLGSVTGRSGKQRRIRRATTALKAGMRLEIHYDAAILARVAPQAVCLHDLHHYSVWYKPPGLLTQGNRYGDHCALLRQVEQWRGGREVFLVHRLDREAAGLVIVAHHRQAAARLSDLFQQRCVNKIYQVRVRGDLRAAHGATGRMNQPLDGKPAMSAYTVNAYDATHDTSVLEVSIATGRKHQIRRHLAGLGYPVLGDPRYGQDAAWAEGLQLCALRLGFICPFTGREQIFELPPTYWASSPAGATR